MTKQQKMRKAVTDKIVAALKAGVAPWAKPWTGVPGDGNPTNIKTGRSYRMTNVWTLNWAQMSKGYPTNEWVTFLQAKDLGGSVLKRPDNVKPGHWGETIVLHKPVDKLDKDGEVIDTYLLIRFATVYNRAQTVGLPEPEVVAERPEVERHAAAEATIAGTGANIVYGGNRAFYDRSADQIVVPNIETFHEPGGFYSTAFHELAHWTGAKHRLDRVKGERFGDQKYAFEELVAELASAYLSIEHSISGKLQHESYIASWIEALENDVNFIFQASSQAQKAADYIIEGSREEAQQAA